MASAATIRRHKKKREAVQAWRYPPGTAVFVRRARGDTVLTFTTSYAFLSNGRHAFVQVHGIPGNTRLDRVAAAFHGDI